MAGTKTGGSALQGLMQGRKVSDKATRSALEEANGRIASLTKRAQHSKEAMVETGTVVLHTAETQGTLFLASMAEGYLGEDKIKIGSVDLRGPLAMLMQGYGLYQTMTGQKGSGAHVMAVGNGLMGSLLASMARNAGRTLAEKRSGTAPALPAPAPMPLPMPAAVPGLQGLMPEPGLSGPMREVLLTPGADGEELGRGGRPMRRRLRERMRRQMARRQSHEVPEEGDEGLEGEELGRRPRRARGRFVRAERDFDDIE